MTCSYCEGSSIPGIHFPSDFSDREDCKDGKVFIAKCDECDRYKSDVEAAEVVSKLTGWPMKKSMDKDDDISPKARLAAKDKEYFRPYFTCTLKEAIGLNQIHKPGQNHKPKTKDNVWCPSCGGGGGEMTRTPKDDYSRPLVYRQCSKCNGAGVVNNPKKEGKAP